MTKKIILDCDPGHDDAVAILLALGNPEIELLGVTTVGGQPKPRKGDLQRPRGARKGARHRRGRVRRMRPSHRASAGSGRVDSRRKRPGRRRAAVPTRPLEQKHAVNYIVETIMASEPGHHHFGSHRPAHQYRDGRAHGAAHR